MLRRRTSRAQDVRREADAPAARLADVRARREAEVLAARDGRKIVLHVGCGHADPNKLHGQFRGQDWREVRLDIDQKVKPDIVGSIVDMPAVPDATVDAVWSSHNLEHVNAHEVPVVLGEFLRVLRPQGVVLITVPDLQHVAKHIAKGGLEETLYISPMGPITPLDMVYGHRPSIEQGNQYMAHHTGFTARTLGQKLEQAGFAAVFVKTPGDRALWATAKKPA